MKRLQRSIPVLKTMFIVNLIGLGVFLLQGTYELGYAESFRFVFMTDIHLQPERGADEAFEQAITTVNNLRPDFVVTGGDLVMDTLEQTFKRSVELFDLYAKRCEQFDMPVYNAIGNHDVFGLYEKGVIDTDHPEYGKKMFKKRVADRTYRSFDHEGWHFILLDSIGITDDRRYIGRIDADQIRWIENDLKDIDKSTPIAIITHIPFVSITSQLRSGATASMPPHSGVVNSHQVLALFKGYNLRLVLQGHLHIVEESIIGGIHFITGGAVSGKWWEGPFHGFPEGFLLIEVDDDDFSWKFQTYRKDPS
ncbi:MAG: metallophosphoesterase [Desulfobacterales bacterium]